MAKDETDRKLKAYNAKRRFGETPEPAAGAQHAETELLFVVHKHAARHLHYDLRLELDGVLKSWAVPRGPSLDPAVKRLAVMVEDHPLAYREFEGVIPEGHYGAGSVIIWDRGVYRHPAARSRGESEQLLRAGLRKGELKFVLFGEKLRGEFALVKMARDDKGWLLLKKKDRHVGGDELLAAQRSVVSGRTLEELLAAAPPSPARRNKLEQLHLREVLERGDLADAPRGPLPHGIRPMLATPVRAPFDHPDWLFEVKWDGYRAIAEIDAGKVALYSRNLLPFEHKFAPVAEALRACRFEAVLDGEIVAVDEQGQPDFQLLQDYPQTGRGHLLYYLFDLLHFQGHDLTGLPLQRRKELLKRVLPASPRLRFSEHVVGDGSLFFSVVRDQGLEGIVAKQVNSPYRIGTRSRDWLKVKARLTQEGVIAGYTAPRGTGRPFGTLVLGVYRGDTLSYVGHAGGGFDARELRAIFARLQPLISKECPFPSAPPTHTPAVWVRPKLVCEVAFTGWTAEGLLRHPVFLRLREDKAAREVLIEGGEGA